MSEHFTVTRLDGRSNAAVLIDYIKDGAPDRLYGYAELGAALEVGSTRRFEPKDVRAVVTAAYPLVLKKLDRALQNVRGVGYRIARAGEHKQLALTRTRRADVQMKRGWQTLQHVRFEEMSEAERLAHEGTLMIVGALYQQQQAMDRRLRAVEDAIRGLRKA